MPFRAPLSRVFRASAVLAFTVQASCTDREVIAPIAKSPALSLNMMAVADGPSGFVLAFNGTTSSAGTPNGAPVTNEIDDIRLEAWVKWAGPTASAQVIIYNGHSGVSGWGVFLNGDKLALLAGGVEVVQSTAMLTVGQWQHLSVERRADGSVILSVDGAQFALAIGANPVGGGFASVERTLVGRGTGPNDPADTPGDVFNGLIDNVKISTTSGTLIEQWNFDDGSSDLALGVNGAQLLLRNVTRVLLGTAIGIDVNPRQEGQRIEPERGGPLEVAVLSSADFDAATVDEATVRFGPGGATPLRSGVSVDVDHDGDRDLLLSFDLGATGISCVQTTVLLAAATQSGESVAGTDAILTLASSLPANTRIVRCDAPQVLATDVTPGALSGSAVGINDRGEVNGLVNMGTGNVIYRWRDAVLTTQPLASTTITVLPINERGQIAGRQRVGTTIPAVFSGFLWDGEVVTDLGVDGTNTNPTTLDKHGAVAGRSLSAPAFLFYWKDGVTATLLETPDMSFFTAIGITNRGEVGGRFVDAAGSSRVYLWEGKFFSHLSAPNAIDIPSAMNDRGLIVGSSRDLETFDRYPTLWSTAGSSRLSRQPGFAVAINKHDQVLIRSDLGEPPFIWSNGSVTRLAGAGDFSTVATALNDLGQATGQESSRAVFWDAAGTSVNLTGGQFATRSSIARTLNNNGQVIGTYIAADNRTRAVLWTITGR